MSPRTGRPHKDVESVKSHRLELRLTEAENDMIQGCADSLSTSKSNAVLEAVNRLTEAIQTSEGSTDEAISEDSLTDREKTFIDNYRKADSEMQNLIADILGMNGETARTEALTKAVELLGVERVQQMLDRASARDQEH